MTQRRKFSPEFKARVVLEIITDQKSIPQASREYSNKDSVLIRWKQEFIERSPQLFVQGTTSDDRDQRIVELERIAAGFREKDISVRVVTVVGQPHEGIVRFAEEEQVDLIAICTHGHSGLTRWLIGSVADRVTRGALSIDGGADGLQESHHVRNARIGSRAWDD
jgi:nucleotide-binding universal stress UspA family protein